MNIIERAKAPTPKFFKILRAVGLALLAVSGTIFTAPISLPVIVMTVAGYAAVAGGVLSAVSQITVDSATDSAQSLDSARDDTNSTAAPDDTDNNLNKARDGIE